MPRLIDLQFRFWLALFCCSSCCFAAPVTIRVIDIHNGQPLRNANVSVAFLNETPDKAPAGPGSNISGETDANGEMKFQIVEPEPAHFSIVVRLASEYFRCGCWISGNTTDLIQKGIVGPLPDDKSEKSDTVVKAVPGEVLILARPLSFFERLLYPLVKE